MPISFERVVQLVGHEVAAKARDAALTLYARGRDYARERGIVIADTKFEFGLLDNELILIDECLTPDSSRFWPTSEVVPGGHPDLLRQAGAAGLPLRHRLEQATAPHRRCHRKLWREPAAPTRTSTSASPVSR